jgi:hypothetical protein
MAESWDLVDGKNHPLQRLGELTVRLLRLSVHQQLLRGKEQLRAQGLVFPPTNTKSPETKKPKIYESLEIVERGKW